MPLFIVFSRGGMNFFFFYFIQKVIVDWPTEKSLKRERHVSPGKCFSGFPAEDTEAATSSRCQPSHSSELPGKH